MGQVVRVCPSNDGQHLPKKNLWVQRALEGLTLG